MEAALALPFLDAMSPALSAAASSGGTPAVRFGASYVPNGINMARWTPGSVGTGVRFLSEPECARAVEDYVNIISGLDSDPGDGNRGNGDHARCQPAWLAHAPEEAKR